MEAKIKGTMILRYRGRFFKVIKVRSCGNNSYIFECLDTDSKQTKTLEFRLSGFLEAADQAFSTMMSPRDTLLMDLDDNEGRWKVIPEAQAINQQ